MLRLIDMQTLRIKNWWNGEYNNFHLEEAFLINLADFEQFHPRIIIVFQTEPLFKNCCSFLF